MDTYPQHVLYEAGHLAPTACYVCGNGPHEPRELHTYWANSDASAHFARQPEGALPSMTAAETLDPREAVTTHKQEG